MKMRNKLLLLICTVLCLVAPFSVSAQSSSSTGAFGGTVTDVNGAVVPGATITIKNEKTGETRTANVGDDGAFRIGNLQPTLYTITATGGNFQPSTQTGIELLVGQEQNLTLILQLQGVGAQVNVISGEETAINTQSASQSVNVTPREVANLPLNGRQVSQLYLQAPGAVNSGSGTFGDIRFNARAVEQNIIRYDGIEGSAVIDAEPGTLNGEISSPFRLQSSLENVQEFRVESSNFPAEFGTGTGGQISLITKSGGNNFHGSLFEYFRNDKLDAANFFDNITGSKSPLRLNQFGGSVGGPIIKNKLFFFGSYEGYRLSAGINSVEAVPGDAARICAVVACNAATLVGLPAFRDPRAVIVSRGTGTNLFDVAQLQGKQLVKESAYSLRLDYTPSDNNRFYFRAFRDDGSNLQPEGVSGRNLDFTANPQNAVASWQHVFNPNLINDFKLGYNSAFTRTNGVARSVTGLDLSAAAINISGNTANFSIPGQGTSAGTSNPGGLIRANSASNGRGQPYTAYTVSFVDNLSYVVGNHNTKFGAEVRPVRIYTDRNGGTTFVFNSLTDYLTNNLASVQYQGDLSDPSPFNNGITGNREAKQEYYIAYAQDEWKIRQNLTLNYGLRYEFYSPLREKSNAQVLFNTTTGTLRPSSERAFRTDKKAFGPRIGLTYSPLPNSTGFFGGNKSVFRGGFGIYYGPGQTEDQIQPIESDRINATLTGGSNLPGFGTVTFTPNVAGLVSAIRQNFVNNLSNAQYQPRAYTSDYLVPEKIYSFTASYQQELPYKITSTVAYVGSRGRNLFLRGLSNTLRPGNAVILNGQALPTNAGVVDRTNAAGQVIGVTTIRQFDILNADAISACGASAGNAICKPFAEIDTKTSGGTDSYNALQISLARRLSSGLTLNAQYSFAKSFGNTSGSNEARTAAQPVGGEVRPSGDYNNYEADRGANNFDVRHTFNLSAIYDLPIGKGKTYDLGKVGNAFLGNWEVGTIINSRSGIPIDITITRPDTVAVCSNSAGCLLNTGEAATTTVANGFTINVPTVSTTRPLPAGFIVVQNSPGGGSSRQTRRPNLVAGVSPYLNNDRSFLNPAAFTTPAAGTFGNLPRNALKGPNFSQADIILNKRFRFSERFNAEFRTEIFNILNKANFSNPASTISSALPSLTFSTTANGGAGAFVLGSGLQPGDALTQSRAGSAFGLLRSTVERTVGLGTNRQIQFALRLNF